MHFDEGKLIQQALQWLGKNALTCGVGQGEMESEVGRGGGT